MARHDLIRSQTAAAQRGRVTEVDQLSRLAPYQLHTDQREWTPGSPEVGLPQRPVAPGLNGLGNSVFR